MAFPDGWSRRCAIVIDYTKVGSGGVSNFPILLSGADFPDEMKTTGGSNAAQTNGGDIRFTTDADGASRLACEIVDWTENATPASATAEIWVNVTSLSSVANTTIYVWYKGGGSETQPAANAAYGSQAVWNSGYKAVWHLNDGADTSHVNDSTANAHTGTKNGAAHPAVATGQIGGGQNIAGTDYIQVNDHADFSLATTDSCTVSGWVKQSATNARQNIYRHDAGIGNRPIVGLRTTDGNKSQFFLCNDTSALPIATGATNVGTNWRYLVGVRDVSADKVLVFLDGADDSEGGVTDSTTATINPTDTVLLGACHDTGGSFAEKVSGLIDEIRFSNTCRSAPWILTEYNNQNAPGTFAAPGTPVGRGVPVVYSFYHTSLDWKIWRAIGENLLIENKSNIFNKSELLEEELINSKGLDILPIEINKSLQNLEGENVDNKSGQRNYMDESVENKTILVGRLLKDIENKVGARSSTIENVENKINLQGSENEDIENKGEQIGYLSESVENKVALLGRLIKSIENNVWVVNSGLTTSVNSLINLSSFSIYSLDWLGVATHPVGGFNEEFSVENKCGVLSDSPVNIQTISSVHPLFSLNMTNLIDVYNMKIFSIDPNSKLSAILNSIFSIESLYKMDSNKTINTSYYSHPFVNLNIDIDILGTNIYEIITNYSIFPIEYSTQKLPNGVFLLGARGIVWTLNTRGIVWTLNTRSNNWILNNR